MVASETENELVRDGRGMAAASVASTTASRLASLVSFVELLAGVVRLLVDVEMLKLTS